MIPVLFVLGIIGIFIGGIIIHIGVIMFGGSKRKGYSTTVKALAYGNTPGLLLGWIPFIGVIFVLWAIVLEILGIRELHETSTLKAIAAILVPTIIIGIVIGVLILISGFVVH